MTLTQGMGARSRDFVKALIKSEKYDVKILSQRWGNTRKGFLDDFEEWEFLKDHIVPNLRKNPTFGVKLQYPMNSNL